MKNTCLDHSNLIPFNFTLAVIFLYNHMNSLPRNCSIWSKLHLRRSHRFSSVNLLLRIFYIFLLPYFYVFLINCSFLILFFSSSLHRHSLYFCLRHFVFYRILLISIRKGHVSRRIFQVILDICEKVSFVFLLAKR